jgi:hypothetical protein
MYRISLSSEQWRRYRAGVDESSRDSQNRHHYPESTGQRLSVKRPITVICQGETASGRTDADCRKKTVVSSLLFPLSEIPLYFPRLLLSAFHVGGGRSIEESKGGWSMPYRCMMSATMSTNQGSDDGWT